MHLWRIALYRCSTRRILVFERHVRSFFEGEMRESGERRDAVCGEARGPRHRDTASREGRAADVPDAGRQRCEREGEDDGDRGGWGGSGVGE